MGFNWELGSVQVEVPAIRRIKISIGTCKKYQTGTGDRSPFFAHIHTGAVARIYNAAIFYFISPGQTLHFFTKRFGDGSRKLERL